MVHLTFAKQLSKWSSSQPDLRWLLVQIHEASLCDNGHRTAVVVKEFTGEHGDDDMTAEEVDTELCACWVLRGHHHVAPVIGVVECAAGGPALARLRARGAPAAASAPPAAAPTRATVRALVMQRFSGSLQRTLEVLRGSADPDGRALSTETLLRIILALSNALACAHRRGMLHMDVKPANVLVQVWCYDAMCQWVLAHHSVRPLVLVCPAAQLCGAVEGGMPLHSGASCDAVSLRNLCEFHGCRHMGREARHAQNTPPGAHAAGRQAPSHIQFQCPTVSWYCACSPTLRYWCTAKLRGCCVLVCCLCCLFPPAGIPLP